MKKSIKKHQQIMFIVLVNILVLLIIINCEEPNTSGLLSNTPQNVTPTATDTNTDTPSEANKDSLSNQNDNTNSNPTLVTASTTLNYRTYFQDGVNNIDGLDGAAKFIISPDGKSVYVLGKEENALSVFSRHISTGVLTYSTTLKNGLDTPKDIAIDKDGKHVYVLGSFDKAIAIFNRNTSTGDLTYTTTITHTTLRHPTHLAISPDGNNVYVSSYLSNQTNEVHNGSIIVLNRNSTTGILTYVESFDDSSGNERINGPNDIVVSADGKNVYVANSLSNSLLVFNRNTQTGTLTYSTAFVDNVANVGGLHLASGLALSPDQKHLYVTSLGDDSIALFNRDLSTGALTYSLKLFVNGTANNSKVIAGLSKPYHITISPDGSDLYATGYDEHAVVLFIRDTSTGNLAYSSTIKNGTGANGIKNAYDIQVSPNGKNVYVTGYGNDAIAVFDRN